jgi:two-component system response regulator PrrA
VLRRPVVALRAGFTGPRVLGNTVIDPDRHEVTIAGTQVELRSKEYDLLLMLAQNLGLVLEREKLLNKVWG